MPVFAGQPVDDDQPTTFPGTPVDPQASTAKPKFPGTPVTEKPKLGLGEALKETGGQLYDIFIDPVVKGAISGGKKATGQDTSGIGKNLTNEELAATMALGGVKAPGGKPNVFPGAKAAEAPKVESITGYHGTQADFEKFEKTEDIGFHFSSSKDTAEEFANFRGKKGRVIEAQLGVKNPIVMPDLGGWSPLRIAEWIDDEGMTAFKQDKKTGSIGELEGKILDLYKKHGAPKGLVTDEGLALAGNTVWDFLQAKGHDGIKYTNKQEGKPVDTYIVRHNEQIKQRDQNSPPVFVGKPVEAV